MKISHVTYRSYSGPKISGAVKYIPSPTATHWERVFNVTTAVESGSGGYGAIVGYDGTGITAGLHQAILVYPKELANEDYESSQDQGSLVQLLRLFEFIPNFPERDKLWYEFKLNGWYVAPDNKIRYTIGKAVKVRNKLISVSPGDVVFGAELRNTITGFEGKVPKTGPLWDNACKWATLFHKVFVNPVTFPIQIKFGMDHSKHSSMSMRLKNGLSVSQFIYGSSDSQEPFIDCPELDIAMTVFWSHSVNAPAIAKKCLQKAVDQTKFQGYKVGNKKDFGKVLLKILGTTQYGRWDDDVVGGRYQRTRDIMMKTSCSLWEPKHFAALGVMPRKFI